MHFTSQVSCLEMLGTCPVVGIMLEISRGGQTHVYKLLYGGYTNPGIYPMESIPWYIFCGGYTQYTQVHILWQVYTGTYSQKLTVRVCNWFLHPPAHRQSAANMLSCENMAAKSFCYSVHSANIYQLAHVKYLLSIFTADCLCHTVRIAGVETIILHTLTVINFVVQLQVCTCPLVGILGYIYRRYTQKCRQQCSWSYIKH